MDIQNIDFSKIFLMSTKKGYRVTYNMGKLKLTTPYFPVPFGIENYNNKEIINIDMIPDNNEKYNFVNYIQTIDNLFKQYSRDNKNIDYAYPLIKFSPDFIKDSSTKEYSNSTKKSLYGSILRTHFKNAEIFKMVNGNKILLQKKDIIKQKCKFEIEISDVWLYGEKYGLIWYVTKIEIE